MRSQYHSKFFAYDLTRRCPSDTIEKLAGALVDAQVDLNPHQVEAALFAFRSPFSKGALLADEVGLGKTIEAGLVIAQKWAERKRRILVITPANLRKQWHQELQEKFFLPGEILEAKPYNEKFRKGHFNPFDSNETIVICSYQFARSKATDIKNVKWDLVIIDEAHRLRNVYKSSNIIANTLKMALKDTHKLLLTATPLQNSLLELFGLVSFIDEHAFGDLNSFREQYSTINNPVIFDELKSRLAPICHRTLRRQVTAYVPYTKRHSMVEPFTPGESEDRLYELVSEYLRRETLKALPKGQRSLITLVLRKLLSSSTFAIAGALETMINRLKSQVTESDQVTALDDALSNDYDGFSSTADEWNEESEQTEPITPEDRIAIISEIAELESFRDLAMSVPQNAKGQALLTALNQAFQSAANMGAAKKAIIFTESRKTQDYLLKILEATEFANDVVLFNGSNNDEKSKKLYLDWIRRHEGSDRVTGVRAADMRSALVDYFRESGKIMIATEAGAEGINLQFCSLVVNYDLPWNPQRIEQRIGRCHRYGQKHDVVVVNFLNQKNEADQRVFELLSKKFALFEGVFGASDEILGAIESGVDFERRIAEIYQQCRTPEEIKISFDQLQLELFPQINSEMTRTRQQLLENFDEEVHEKLRIRLQDGNEYLKRHEQRLMDLTRQELAVHASFDDSQSAFTLHSHPFPSQVDSIPLGRYELPRRSGGAHFYRLGHPLAAQVIQQAKSRELPPVEITFNYSQNPVKISLLEPLVGSSGQLAVKIFSIESLDQGEDHLLIAAITDTGDVLDPDVAKRFFSLSVDQISPVGAISNPKIDEQLAQQQAIVEQNIRIRNSEFIQQESEKLDAWADDLKVALEREIKDIDRQITEARKAAKIGTLEAKLAGQKQVKTLEGLRSQKRRSLFESQDDIDARRDALIEGIEGKLVQRTEIEELFWVRWRLV